MKFKQFLNKFIEKKDERDVLFIVNKTPEICLEAVKEKGGSLPFVHTKEIKNDI